MVASEKLFGNFFDDIAIINRRLYGFGFDSINRLTSANGGGDYTDLISLVTPPITALGKELGDVDTALNQQKGKTITNNQVIAAFKLTMSQKKGVLADLLGGVNTPAFLEFYPHGGTEYSNVTKEKMPLLVDRVFAAAAAHAGAIGATNEALLKSFKALWKNSRDDQEQQFGTVTDNRSERTVARTDSELALLTAVHTIGAKFPGSTEECVAFFDFSLLYNVVHHTYTTYRGVIAAGETKLIVNKLLTDNNKIHAYNPDDNSNYQLYSGATDSAQPNGTGKIVKFGHGIRPKPSQLGLLTNPFWLIKNLSDVNEGAYIIEISD
jgi:hypothetical protein